MSSPLEPLDILYLALAEPIGLLLAVEGDREASRQRLYQARVKAGDDALAELQIRVSPFGDGGLVVCHQRPTVGSQLGGKLGGQQPVKKEKEE